MADYEIGICEDPPHVYPNDMISFTPVPGDYPNCQIGRDGTTTYPFDTPPDYPVIVAAGVTLTVADLPTGPYTYTISNCGCTNQPPFVQKTLTIL
jgi:hypothetical protein